MTITTLAPLSAARDLLETTNTLDPTTPYQQWRSQILVPDTLPPADGLPVTIALVNQKGGAGKTTSSLELGAAWAARGMRVRIIDADPQDASITGWLAPQYPAGLSSDQLYSLADVYREKATLDQATWPTAYKNLHLVPSYPDLALVEYDPAMSEHALRYAMEDSVAPFDVNIIDCPPTLGKFSLGGLIAARYALVPAQVSNLDGKGMAALSGAIEKIKARPNRALEVRAVILMGWERSNLARGLQAQIAGDWPGAIVAPVRRNIDAATAPGAGMPIREWDPTSKPASDYDQLADLIIPAPRGAA